MYIFHIFIEAESKIKELASKLDVMEAKQYTGIKNVEHKNNELQKHNTYLVSIILYLFIY